MNVAIGDLLTDKEGIVWVVDSTMNHPPTYAYLKQKPGLQDVEYFGGIAIPHFNEIGESQEQGLEFWPFSEDQIKGMK